MQHPKPLGLLATSGIDDTVKLFAPVGDRAAPDAAAASPKAIQAMESGIATIGMTVNIPINRFRSVARAVLILLKLRRTIPCTIHLTGPSALIISCQSRAGEGFSRKTFIDVSKFRA